MISCLVAGEVNIGQVLFHDFNANLLMCFQLKLIAKWFLKLILKAITILKSVNKNSRGRIREIKVKYFHIRYFKLLSFCSFPIRYAKYKSGRLK